MKYVSNHSITLDALREWAGSKTLVTASFFFWNSGFPMQRSQVGLLQSLLYQVLCACPALISVACPQKGPKQLWKRKELFEALDKVSKQTALSAKFCFFVDGLDEYEGDGEDLIALYVYFRVLILPQRMPNELLYIVRLFQSNASQVLVHLYSS
jgi:hypothetical protein